MQGQYDQLPAVLPKFDYGHVDARIVTVAQLEAEGVAPGARAPMTADELADEERLDKAATAQVMLMREQHAINH